MFFSWWRNRKRKAIIQDPTPDSWLGWLEAHWFFDGLSDAEKTKLIDSTKVLFHEKNWEGCGGLVMTDEIRVSVSAQVSWMTLGLADEYFDHVKSILVYPKAYVAEDMQIAGDGLVTESESPRLGEAWYRGPVILTLDDVLAGGRSQNHGRNLVLHEFAHQLDMLNGRVADGVPPIENPIVAQQWLQVTKMEFQSLRRDCHTGKPTLFDCYGATNPAEFFSVTTETFFQLPEQFRQYHRELYNVLSNYYCQDPIGRQ